MSCFYPLLFQPRFKERVWGGRNLERLYRKALPPHVPIGESWEISDRPGEASVIANGPLAGRDLRWLMEHHAAEILGAASPAPQGRFPLLVKILDAQDVLSLQVHPPPSQAAALGGEPKTEMWYFTECQPGACIYAGLKKGVSREDFARHLAAGTAAECVHRLPVQAGDAMFLPSGRLHALGAGCVLFEIQQNSDTTYRVFDWNRPGLDGRPRELHVKESLACIDFADVEPSLIASRYSRSASVAVRYLVDDPVFMVNACRVRRGQRFYLRFGAAQVLGVIQGRLRAGGGQTAVELQAGDFCLLPAALERVPLEALTRVEYLLAEPKALTAPPAP
ncbi:MAG: class I mannose-6-phosphate isomerase [Verrucomicrobiae bacterium]|nr:class I mannose-6-phosphate isomerase [Verrucomicrobiae bacterium]